MAENAYFVASYLYYHKGAWNPPWDVIYPAEHVSRVKSKRGEKGNQYLINGHFSYTSPRASSQQSIWEIPSMLSKIIYYLATFQIVRLI